MPGLIAVILIMIVCAIVAMFMSPVKAINACKSCGKEVRGIRREVFSDFCEKCDPNMTLKSAKETAKILMASGLSSMEAALSVQKKFKLSSEDVDLIAMVCSNEAK